jgi:lipopolysaccharide transport system permease protein
MITIFFEVIKFKQLVLALVERHLRARYRGSLLGFLWSLLNPLILMIIYTIVFNHFMRNGSMPHYEIFLFCGLLPWLWVTSTLAEGASSIVSSGHLITKSFFPAHLLPLVTVLTNLTHYLLSLPILVFFMIYQGIEFQWNLIFLPIIILLQAIFLFGLSLITASLNVLYRDIQHIVGNAITMLFFLNPIVYSISTVPQKYQIYFKYNPFSLWTISYQQIILSNNFDLSNLILMLVFSSTSFITGTFVYNSYREYFAENL